MLPVIVPPDIVAVEPEILTTAIPDGDFIVPLEIAKVPELLYTAGYPPLLVTVPPFIFIVPDDVLYITKSAALLIILALPLISTVPA